MKKIMAALVVLLLLTGVGQYRAFGAVGCDLNDPDRDVARLFPGSSGFKTHYVAIDKKGGEPLLKEVETRLGEKFQGLYETIDVPYTIYEIFKGKEKIGYIHGVNQKGQYGGIQVFLVLDPEGTIRGFYLQKMTSRQAAKLRDPSFGKQFQGMNLNDFAQYDVAVQKAAPGSKVASISNPALDAEEDFKAIMRATKKNLILMDEFVYENRHLKGAKGAS
jgi:hypothetical protein